MSSSNRSAASSHSTKSSGFLTQATVSSGRSNGSPVIGDEDYKSQVYVFTPTKDSKPVIKPAPVTDPSKPSTKANSYKAVLSSPCPLPTCFSKRTNAVHVREKLHQKLQSSKTIRRSSKSVVSSGASLDSTAGDVYSSEPPKKLSHSLSAIVKSVASSTRSSKKKTPSVAASTQPSSAASVKAVGTKSLTKKKKAKSSAASTKPSSAASTKPSSAASTKPSSAASTKAASATKSLSKKVKAPSSTASTKPSSTASTKVASATKSLSKKQALSVAANDKAKQRNMTASQSKNKCGGVLALGIDDMDSETSLEDSCSFKIGWGEKSVESSGKKIQQLTVSMLLHLHLIIQWRSACR